jgi:hypothetical protein
MLMFASDAISACYLKRHRRIGYCPFEALDRLGATCQKQQSRLRHGIA